MFVYFSFFLQTIGTEIAAHEVTMEEMKKRNVTLQSSTSEGKAARGGTTLDQLQVTLPPAGQCQKLLSLLLF